METQEKHSSPAKNIGPFEAAGGCRVVIGATVPSLRGVRTHLILLCRLLRRKGIEVVVFATGSNGDEATIAGLEKIGARAINPVRLHAWAKRRYGSAPVSQKWLVCLCHPREFFNQHD